MRIGVPAELKNHEYRVAMTPAGVREATQHGHEVVVEAAAGQGSSISDDDFRAAGATVLPDVDDVWASADLILKVKEPIEPEWHRLRRGQVLFTYLHLAADERCTRAILDSRSTAIAYETVEKADGTLPLLAPMSEVAGRLAAQVGAYHLMRHNGARGVLIGGVPGSESAKVVVIGGGVAGVNAATIALGMGGSVTILDVSVPRLREIDARFGGRCRTLFSTSFEIEREVLSADLVIGAALQPGARAPKLVSNELVSRMNTGSVLVDVAIDQGGCFEDSHPTSHAAPTYRVHNSVFYCVANMPGSVPRTSTWALTNVTLPYALRLADHGWRAALGADSEFARGLNAHDGRLTNASVGAALGLPSFRPEAVLA